MLFRFSLYGFLKNQQYYDPFLILAFLQKGLSFFMIGVLIGFRELCINLLEIPSGAVADLFGRRRCMILSFSAYVLSFALFGLARAYWMFFPAMFLFAVGEAFRTGTHKALIFSWLQREGRTGEKTRPGAGLSGGLGERRAFDRTDLLAGGTGRIVAHGRFLADFDRENGRFQKRGLRQLTDWSNPG